MSDTKQVIVIRRDLGMRRGKEIAQGSHASMAFLTRRLRHTGDISGGQASGRHVLDLTPAEREWMADSFAKVVCQVASEQELMQIAAEAIDAGLETQLIQDSGRTEFHGVPTYTAVAIGPDFSEKIDKVTGHLTLY